VTYADPQDAVLVIIPFVLSLSKDLIRIMHCDRLCFDRLSTNGMLAQVQDERF